MAESANHTELAQSSRRFGMPDLWRVAIWGIAAAGSLAVAAFASTTAIGIDRLMHAAGQLHEVIRPTGHKPLRPLDAREGQRLAESVRMLTDERERFAARVAKVEQNLHSITGSMADIGKLAEAASKAAEAVAAERAPPALPAIPAEAPVADESTASVNVATPAISAQPLQEPRSAPDPAGKAEFGLDIGGGATIDALRALWIKARQQHMATLDGLRPVVHLRESRRPGVELRLVAGPVPSAVAAARLCAKLTAAGAACQPAVFDGQRLATR